MEYKVAIECGPEYSARPDRAVVDCFSPNDVFTADNVVTVADVLSDIRDGLKLPQIIAKRNIRHKKAVTRGMAWAAVMMPDEYAKLFRTPTRQLRILLDEGVSYHAIPSLIREYGYVTHVLFEGLCGKSDADVIAFAQQNNFDAVFSMDRRVRTTADELTRRQYSGRDLTQIAYDCFREMVHADVTDSESLRVMPLIVHLPQNLNKHYGARHPFARHAQTIAGHIEDRRTPFISVHLNSVSMGPDVERVYDDINRDLQMANIPEHLRSRTRDQAFAELWLNRGGFSGGVTSAAWAQLVKLAGDVITQRDKEPHGRPIKVSGFPIYTDAERAVRGGRRRLHA